MNSVEEIVAKKTKKTVLQSYRKQLTNTQERFGLHELRSFLSHNQQMETTKNFDESFRDQKIPKFTQKLCLKSCSQTTCISYRNIWGQEKAISLNLL